MASLSLQAFGQCPLLIDGDFELVQSNAILRYLGRKYGNDTVYNSYTMKSSVIVLKDDI